MIVTKLEELEKAKVKVYIDGEFHFLLYRKDIKIYKLQENEQISDKVYEEIIENTVLRRAKQKAMAILKYMDRSEQELRQKLKQSDYTETIIEAAIEYVKKFHYLDDERYAMNYIRFKKNTKSKRQLQTELSQKGIRKEYIDLAFQEEYDDEELAIQKAVSKKTSDVDSLSQEEKMKLASSLYRKGFKMDLIQKYTKIYN
ncbi:MAG: regulatory protein RecX [Anaerocolumna aminovalerica]|jgi:regulatory protein|uniref:regulatory protein RecX n=1 Tax=Anaerocolumna aminovalerica TaxID=1527 RepID=UPI002909C280|nr:regulatory protein RecX [Anaerocolumna aminovalerica]MDU6264784.1 regulatory protein RecX [Anaerocolumna aminovalerica]